ncbi:MAG: metal ABC transporter substrate-binding protein [Pseudomonadota bacterium]
MKFFRIFLLLLISANSALASDKPLIVSSINPIYQIVLAITEDKNNSILIINPNISEHDYQLKKSDAEFVAQADLIFYIDDDLEKNFAKLVKDKKSYKMSQVNGIKLLQRRNDPKKIDLHLWLNPENGIKIAEFITQKICEIDAGNAKKYQKNLEKFKKEILKTAKNIRENLQPIQNSGFVFYHDGYQYFEDYFALKPLKIISGNHDFELTIKDVRELDALAKTGQIKCILGDVYDEKNSAKKLAQNYGVKFTRLDLIGEENMNYSNLLFNISTSLVTCL